ncbi:MAG: hypothetical protein ACRCU2_31495 [Planktothrix sp.]
MSHQKFTLTNAIIDLTQSDSPERTINIDGKDFPLLLANFGRDNPGSSPEITKYADLIGAMLISSSEIPGLLNQSKVTTKKKTYDWAAVVNEAPRTGTLIGVVTEQGVQIVDGTTRLTGAFKAHSDLQAAIIAGNLARTDKAFLDIEGIDDPETAEKLKKGFIYQVYPELETNAKKFQIRLFLSDDTLSETESIQYQIAASSEINSTHGSPLRREDIMSNLLKMMLKGYLPAYSKSEEIQQILINFGITAALVPLYRDSKPIAFFKGTPTLSNLSISQLLANVRKVATVIANLEGLNLIEKVSPENVSWLKPICVKKESLYASLLINLPEDVKAALIKESGIENPEAPKYGCLLTTSSTNALISSGWLYGAGLDELKPLNLEAHCLTEIITSGAVDVSIIVGKTKRGKSKTPDKFIPFNWVTSPGTISADRVTQCETDLKHKLDSIKQAEVQAEVASVEQENPPARIADGSFPDNDPTQPEGTVTAHYDRNDPDPDSTDTPAQGTQASKTQTSHTEPKGEQQKGGLENFATLKLFNCLSRLSGKRLTKDGVLATKNGLIAVLSPGTLKSHQSELIKMGAKYHEVEGSAPEGNSLMARYTAAYYALFLLMSDHVTSGEDILDTIGTLFGVVNEKAKTANIAQAGKNPAYNHAYLNLPSSITNILQDLPEDYKTSELSKFTADITAEF